MSEDTGPIEQERLANKERLADQERLADLEMRFAFLDDQVQQLDALVAAQRDLLDRVGEEVRRVKESMESIRPDMPDAGPEPPPPHY